MPAYNFDGEMDSFAVYTRPLSNSDILLEYNGRGGFLDVVTTSTNIEFDDIPIIDTSPENLVVTNDQGVNWGTLIENTELKVHYMIFEEGVH